MFNINNKNDNKIYIILINYNKWEDTIECLESILQNKYIYYQIIVVDNDSKNDSINYLIQWARGKRDVICNNERLKHLIYPPTKKPKPYLLYSENEAICGGNRTAEIESDSPIIFIQANNNRGFAAGNNIAIKYILKKNDFKYVLLINNDTVVESNILDKMIEAANYNEKIGIVGAKIFYYNKPEKIWFNGGKFNKIIGTASHIQSNNNMTISFCTFITGCCMLIKKNVIEKVGLLDESFFMYVEDLDYCYKVHKNRFKLAISHDAHLWHKVGAGNGKKISKFAVYWNVRNIIKFNKSRDESLKYISISLYFFFSIFSLIKWLFKAPKISKAIYSGLIDEILNIKIKNRLKI